MSHDTKLGILGGSLLAILSNITATDIEKSIVLGAIGTIVSFIVSLLAKACYEKLKQMMR